MIWELLRTGHLHNWWEYPLFAACVLLLTSGPVAIWVVWLTRPAGWPGGEDREDPQDPGR